MNTWQGEPQLYLLPAINANSKYIQFQVPLKPMSGQEKNHSQHGEHTAFILWKKYYIFIPGKIICLYSKGSLLTVRWPESMLSSLIEISQNIKVQSEYLII